MVGKNKEIQKLLTKEVSFDEAIKKLVDFRAELFEEITQLVNTYPEKAFAEMPFARAKGYHSKSLAYSIWHIFRIEDIVAHEMIAGDSQVLFDGDFLKRIGSPIITTGNELQGDGIYEFSKQLNVKEKLIRSKCVDEDENAFWLIDYWCGKDVKGLIQMPFSRHWIMHIEAMRRIRNKWTF